MTPARLAAKRHRKEMRRREIHDRMGRNLRLPSHMRLPHAKTEAPREETFAPVEIEVQSIPKRKGYVPPSKLGRFGSLVRKVLKQKVTP